MPTTPEGKAISSKNSLCHGCCSQILILPEEMDPPPELIYRRLNFVHGVPPEYHWATSSPERRARGGFATQRMTVDTWIETIAREQAAGTGHIGPCGQNLPRPQERGGCECPACTNLTLQMQPV